MGEDAKGRDPAGGSGGADPVAVAIGLGGASRHKADEFLDDQRALIADQRHHLREQLKQQHLGIWEQQLGVLLRLATAVVGIAAAAGVAYLIWDAAHVNGVVIEAFSVPPDMDTQGLNGQVVAGQMLDKLNAMQAENGSYRSQKSYSSNWGRDIRLDIPDTGLSVGEIYRFLRGWLGHETPIGGEIYRTKDGIAVTTRAGDQAATFNGPEADLDSLLQKAAESLYSRTQLYRYAGFLRSHGRFDEARPIYERLTQDASPLERAWAWDGLATLASRAGDYTGETATARRAVAVYPDFSFGWYYLSAAEDSSGLAERELAARRKAEQLLGRDSVPDVVPEFLPSMRLYNSLVLAALQGDFAAAETLGRSSEALAVIDGNVGREGFYAAIARAQAERHDGAAMAQYYRDLPPPAPQTANAAVIGNAAPADRRAATHTFSQAVYDAGLEKWRAVLAGLPAVENYFRVTLQRANPDPALNLNVRPLEALARAHLGDRAGAEALIGLTPGDCYDCVRMRGTIAAVFKEWGRADYWFARAVHDAPSIPFAYADWGASLLASGKPDAAIEKFTLANQKGPHFADALEGWGEALMVKNQSGPALEKFIEAAKYAPNWGHLHLKWGEALKQSGRAADAKSQFSIAAGLDLSDADKAELARGA